MSISKLSVNNPVAANILMIAIFFLGIIALTRLPREFLPNIEFNVAIVITPYPGASPEEIEKLVTLKIEEAVEDIEGINYVSSRASEGQTVTFIWFRDMSKTDFQYLVQKVRSAIDSIDDLPDDVEDPVVMEIGTGEMVPVIFVTLNGDIPEKQLKIVADDLADEFLSISDIAKVDMEGDREREIWVEVDPDRLYTYGFSLEQIATALSSTNQNIPAGTIELQSSEYIVRTIGEYANPEELSKVIIRTDPAGHHVRISAVAKIKDTFEKPRTFSYINRKPGITLNLSKKTEGNTIAIVEEVEAIVAKYKQKLPPSCDLVLTNDSSIQIKSALGKLSLNAIIGMIMVIILLYLFLGLRNALFAGVGLPVSLLGTFIFLQLTGQSLNTSSLFALMMVVGIIVDDAIIIIENCHRYMGEGLSAYDAAIKGTQEVIAPVFAACVTTIAAFLPLMFLPDVLGKFLRVVPIVVCLALIASLFEAFFILPAHISEWSGKKVESVKRSKLIETLRALYVRMLKKILKRRYFYTGTVIVVIILSVGLLLSPVVNKELFVTEEISQFFIDVQMPAGTNIHKTDEVLEQIEKRVNTLPKEWISALVTSPGKMITKEEWVFGTDVGQIMVDLVEMDYRDATMDEIIAKLRPLCSDVAGVKSIEFTKFRGGPPTPSDVELKVQGKDFDKLEEITAKIKSSLGSIPGVYDISDDFQTGKKDIKIYIDEDKASLYGLSVNYIAMAIRSAYEGSVATIFREGDEEIDVVVKYDPIATKNVTDIEDLKIATPNGTLIPFRNFATIKIEPGYTSIRRYKQDRAITIRASVDRELNSLEKVDIALKSKTNLIEAAYPNYKIRFESVFAEFQAYQTMLIQLFILGLFLIYFILGTQFKSYSQPLIILFAIPFAFLGAVVGILLTGLFSGVSPIFSIMTLYGIIGLAGIAVNDAIVMITFINNARAKGAGKLESIINSGKLRLRAIILTSITTMCGVFPMVIGLGGKSEIWAPMASTIFFGLGVATVLTLFIIPCLYHIIIDDIGSFFKRN